MLESVVAGYPDLDLGIHVVWASMLGSDNEESARQISKMFDDPRVEQYWDPKRLLATSYSAQVFPSYLVDMGKGFDAVLPDDHWWRERERNWKSAKPEQAPLWDVAFTYGKGARWGSTPPVPRGMVKQVFFYGEQENGPTGMFFTDFQQPPRDGDWIAEVSQAMTSLVGRGPQPFVATATSETAAEAAGCQGGSLKATVIALKLNKLNETQVERVEQALGAVEGVMRASFDLDSKIMTVFVDLDGPASADKLLKYLELAGYAGTEASGQELEQALDAMRTGGAIVFRREDASADARTVTFPDTPAGRIAEAFIAAFNSGDENKMRVFSERQRSKSTLESRSMKERLEQYRELHSDWGRLDVRNVEAHDERNLTVTVKPERGLSGLAMTFQCESAPPYKLSEIRIGPTHLNDGNDEPSNEGSEGGKMGEVTLLTESLKPLRDHFNANKHKYRFVALLSPT